MTKTILIVDSDLSNIKKYGKFLAAKGFNVLVATEQKQAILIAQEKKPDLIFTPQTTKVINGETIYKSLQKNKKAKNIRFVFSTSPQKIKPLKATKKQGNLNYISTPVLTKRLFDEINNCFKTTDNKDKLATIMVVDDIPINQDLIEDLLSDTTLNIIKSSGGKDSIKKIKEHTVNLILLDIEMPEMDGWETLEEYKKMELHIPVFALSAHDDASFKKRCLMHGFTNVITKPIDKKKLIHLVENALFENIKKNKTVKTSQKKAPITSKNNIIDISQLIRVSEDNPELKADTLKKITINILKLKKHFSSNKIATEEKENCRREIHTLNNLSSYFCKKEIVKKIKAFETLYKTNFNKAFEKRASFLLLLESIETQLKGLEI